MNPVWTYLILKIEKVVSTCAVNGWSVKFLWRKAAKVISNIICKCYLNFLRKYLRTLSQFHRPGGLSCDHYRQNGGGQEVKISQFLKFYRYLGNIHKVLIKHFCSVTLQNYTFGTTMVTIFSFTLLVVQNVDG